MTYNITVAGRCEQREPGRLVKRRSGMPVALAALVGMVGIALTGCGTNNNILSSKGTANGTNGIPTALAPNKQPARAKIAIAPIIGAPDNIARQLTASLSQAIAAQRVAVARDKGEPVDYTLRGYVVAAKEARNTKLSYIWDVTDPKGRRVNRITGEQTVTGSSSRDPWVAISPAIIQTIADKTASSFGTWLPAKPPQQAVASSQQSRSSGQATAPRPRGTALTSAAPAPTTSQPVPVALKPPAATTPQRILAYVPAVSGAPGDGRVSLTNALKKELQRGGITVVKTPSAATHQVIGKVVVGKGAGGTQPIKIDWNVRDAKGVSLGSVSQKNQIPSGSLDGPWGKIADAAAGAAAQGILKLLPRKTATR